MKRFLGFVFTLISLPLCCFAQDKVDGFAARTYQSSTGAKMPYRLFIPEGYDRRTQYPLIMWLHGSGGSGSDNLQQIEGDQVPGTRLWTKAENQSRHPAFVLVPQTANLWEPSFVPPRSGAAVVTERDLQLSPQLNLVLGILKSLQAEFSIDPARIYISGQSLGGIGAWNFVTKRPDLFAAAIILCGGGNPNLAARAKNVPIWVFQGAKDQAFVSRNRAMIAALQKAGGKPRYTEYPSLGHAIWNRTFSDPDLVEWLFAQHQ